MLLLPTLVCGQADSVDYRPMGSGYEPSSITTVVEYDVESRSYVRVRKLGDMVLSREWMTMQEYQD